MSATIASPSENPVMHQQTLYDKLWNQHVVHVEDDGTTVLYIDRQLLHEVTTPQAFEGLKLTGRKVWRLSANVATVDHSIPTTPPSEGIADPIARLQVETLDKNVREWGIKQYFEWGDPRQGIVHVISPEQGSTLPGMTLVCGDSHTSTHGALGALAFGIGTSEVEHALATQTLLARKMKNMLVQVDGVLPAGITAKDPSTICMLLGSTTPLPAARIAERYASRQTYLDEFTKYTDSVVRAGWILSADRGAVLALARPDRVGGAG